MHHAAQNAHAERHDDKAEDQRRLATPAVDQPDGDKGRQHVGQTDDDGAPHLFGGVGIACQFKNLRRVVHDDVHTGELLHHLQQDAEEYRTAEVAVFFKQRPAGLFYLQAFADLIQLAFRFSAGVAQAQQDAFGVDKAALSGKPARAVRQENHANQQQHRRDNNHPEHPAPGAAVAECRIGKIGAENTNGNHQLVHRNHAAADFFRCDFRQIQRGGIGGDAHGQAEQHAGDQQHFYVRRGGGEQRAGNEQDGANHQAFFTPEFEGEPAAAHRADGGAEHHRADHPFLSVGAYLELIGNKG